MSSVNETVKAECGEYHDVSDYGFWFDGVFLSIIGIIGLFGNLLALVVLSRPKLRDLFHQLLIGLACFDILYIICGGVNYTFRAFEAKSDIYTYLFPYFLHPFTQVAMSGTIFMTLAISIERYLGLCHPLLPPTARRSWFYLLPVVLSSFIISAPKFLEVELTFITDDKNVSSPAYGHTKLRMSENYIRYYIMWTRIFSTAIIPIVLLLFFNARIIIDLFSSRVKRFGSVNRQRKETNLCFILLCIVLVFFLCHTARIVLDVIEFSHLEQILYCKRVYNRPWSPPYWANVVYHVSHVMMMINSSFNFVIYCLVGHTFRRELCRTLGLRVYTYIPGGTDRLTITGTDPPLARQNSGFKLETKMTTLNKSNSKFN